jgi:hypothetical protein
MGGDTGVDTGGATDVETGATADGAAKGVTARLAAFVAGAKGAAAMQAHRAGKMRTLKSI